MKCWMLVKNICICLFSLNHSNQRTNGPVNAHLISGPIRFFKVFNINEHGYHLGHVTCTIYINFLSHFSRRLNMKFGTDWPSGFRGEDV